MLVFLVGGRRRGLVEPRLQQNALLTRCPLARNSKLDWFGRDLVTGFALEADKGVAVVAGHVQYDLGNARRGNLRRVLPTLER